MCDNFNPEHSCPLCDGTEDSDSSLQVAADRLAEEYLIAVTGSREPIVAHTMYLLSEYPNDWYLITDLDRWEW